MSEPSPPSDLLATFKAESEAQISQLTEGILSLEKNSDQPKLIEDLLRAAHTLKGNARFMEFLQIQDLAHALEDVLEGVFSKKISFTTELANLSLKSVDSIMEALHSPSPSKSASPDVSQLCEALKRGGRIEEGPMARSPGGPDQPARLQEESILVPVSRIDEIFNLIAEVAIHKGSASQDLLVDELQAKAKTLRLRPCSTLFEGFGRLARDIAQQQQKKVRLTLAGGETLMDKQLLEVLRPCLIHLVRNAVDHGIEPPARRMELGKPEEGTISLGARREADQIVFEMSDDGAGIDTERLKTVAVESGVVTKAELARMNSREILNLVFASGLSTSRVVTDISGRGIGMDIVRSELERIQGAIWLESELGKGTRAILRVPLTIASVKVLIVEANGYRFGIPMSGVAEILKIAADAPRKRRDMEWRERAIPLEWIADALNLPSKASPNPKPRSRDAVRHAPTVVVDESSGRPVGYVVERVENAEEVVIKRLENPLGKLRSVAGAALLPSGEVLVVLEMAELAFALSKRAEGSRVARVTENGGKRRKRILLVEDSATTRKLERQILESEGYEVETAVDGLEGLEKVSSGSFDLVVSDVEMPRMDGISFCKAMRKNPAVQDLPFVFVTTLDDPAAKLRGLEAGAQAYFSKTGFNQRALLETIARLME